MILPEQTSDGVTPSPQTHRLFFTERLDCPYVDVFDGVESIGGKGESFAEKKQFYADARAIEVYVASNPRLRGWLGTTRKDNYGMIRLFFHLGARAYHMNDRNISFKKELKHG